VKGPLVCVGAVAVDSDRLLMVRRANDPGAGEWSIPGGHVEPGELLAEAVVRELLEETAVEGVCGELVGWEEFFDGDDHYVILDFRVAVLEGSEPHAGDDAVEARWIPVADVAELNLVAGLAPWLHEHGIIPTMGLD
jgi:ADP-ribose pyrophosphatase YjhB (NUDIX family)